MVYIPATIALIMKLLLLYYGGRELRKNKESKTLFALLLMMVVMGIVELASFHYANNPELFAVFLRVYYVSLVVLGAFLLQLSLLTVYKTLSNKIDLINFGLATLMCFLILFTDMIIAGAQSIGYSVTRIPGELYWIAQIYGITMIFSSLCILALYYIKATDPATKVKIVYVLLAVFCQALPILIVIPLMAVGIKVNATFVFPIGNVLFLCFVTYAVKKERLYDIRFWLPFSNRYKLFKAYNGLFMVSKDGSEMSAKEHRRVFEKVYLLTMILNYKDSHSQREMAQKMGISESSLSKKRKEFGI